MIFIVLMISSGLCKVSTIIVTYYEVLDLQKCVDCLWNYYGCYLMQYVYTGYIGSWILFLSSLYILLCILDCRLHI